MKWKKALEENYKLLLSISIFLALIGIAFYYLTPKQQYFFNTVTLSDGDYISATHYKSGKKIKLEIASSDQKRQEGLMFRDFLAPDNGMLFIFETEDMLSFWMKNTSSSLDRIFLDKNQKVTSFFENTKTMQIEETYKSKSPSQYAIEMPAGWALENKLEVGDTFEFSSAK